MGHKCAISGKSRQHGHRVSHAKNRRKHVFRANLQNKSLYNPVTGETVRVKLSTRVIRTIDKLGLNKTLQKYGLTFDDLR